METLTPHQAWQELVKIQKFLKVFDQLEEVLKPLAEYQHVEENLKREVINLQEMHTKKLAELDLINVAIMKANETVETVKKTAVSATKFAEDQALMTMAAAEASAKKLRKESQESVERVNMELANLKPQVKILREEKQSLEQAILRLKKQAKTRMDDFVDALKMVGE